MAATSLSLGEHRGVLVKNETPCGDYGPVRIRAAGADAG